MRAFARARPWGTVGLVLLVAAAPAAGEVVQATPAVRAPIIDGKLDDACWRAAKPVETFRILNTSKLAEFGTRASVVYTDSAIYVGVRCDEPDVANIQTRELPRDHSDVYRTDCIEIMLDPAASRLDYFHIGINASGSIFDRACTQGGFIGDVGWNGDMTAKTHVGRDFWSCEVAIPFRSLRITPKVGANWRINICREKKKPAENSSIAGRGVFNVAGGFAELRGVDVDFSRFCQTIGEPAIDMRVREGALDVRVDVPVLNETGRDVRASLLLALISPTGKTFVENTEVALPVGKETICRAGRFTLAEQGTYTCVTAVRDGITKRTLAERRRPLTVEYVPMRISLVTPWYRDAIFATQEIESVEADVEVGLEPGVLADATLEVGIRPAAAAADAFLTAQRLAAVAATQRVTFDAGKLPDGGFEVVAILRDGAGKELARTSHALRKLPPKQGEVWLGRDSQWHVDGKPFFINGAWNYPKDFVEGYNVFSAADAGVMWLGTEVMNLIYYKCKSAKEKVLSQEDAELIRGTIRELRDTPNLFGYYVSDEPEVSNFSASAMEGIYQVIAREDPYHPVVISNDSMHGLESYARCGDINGLHPYPVVLKDSPHCDLSAIAKWVTAATKFFDGRSHKQTIAYLHQGFNYGDHGAVNNRIPGYREYRNQNLLAAIAGANGFIQFNRAVAHYPELYIGMPHLVREQAYLGKAILAPTSSTVPKASSDKVMMLLKEVGEALFLLACNADAEPRAVTIEFPGIGKRAGRLQVISEDRTVKTSGDAIVDEFDPWEVHVYTTATPPGLLTVGAICQLIDEANASRRKPGNLAFQMFEGDGVLVRASTNEAAKRRVDNGLWHVVDGIVDAIDHYKTLTWTDTTPKQFPDWVEVQLPKAATIGRVVVYPFDKSLRDYEIQAFADGQWKTVDRVVDKKDDNIVHRFDAIETDRIRVFVTAANGPCSRVTEIEIYEK